MELWADPPEQPFIGEIPGNYGGTQPKKLMIDARERRWFFKEQGPISALKDVVVARVVIATGVPTPVVYARQFYWNGRSYQGTLQPWLGDMALEGAVPRDLSHLTQEQAVSLQRHQVVDWLIANPDAHRRQFLILADRTIVAIDKSQALKALNWRSLRWDNRDAIRNRKPPVYIALFRAARNGLIHLDPNVALSFGNDVIKAIPDEWLKDTWRPYVAMREEPRWWFELARSNARHPNVERVLDTIVERKRTLGQQLSQLYYERSNGLWHR